MCIRDRLFRVPAQFIGYMNLIVPILQNMEDLLQRDCLHIFTDWLRLRKIEPFFRVLLFQFIAYPIFRADDKFFIFTLSCICDNAGGASYIIRYLSDLFRACLLYTSRCV